MKEALLNKKTSNEYIINGGKKLFGEVKLSGAKNAALPMIVAACLGDNYTKLNNVPMALKDVNTLIGILKELGAEIFK
ncbi:hypothetical protein [Sinobaca sp. H24]|uniref:hypothetical protein n=1 Tax=Sinobaca sp. H24 TaxID=2923376 RepID=UPI00207969C9|nr:hypothetical protein [Sinobaca sp. H24]